MSKRHHFNRTEVTKKIKNTATVSPTLLAADGTFGDDADQQKCTRQRNAKDTSPLSLFFCQNETSPVLVSPVRNAKILRNSSKQNPFPIPLTDPSDENFSETKPDTNSTYSRRLVLQSSVVRQALQRFGSSNITQHREHEDEEMTDNFDPISSFSAQPFTSPTFSEALFPPSISTSPTMSPLNSSFDKIVNSIENALSNDYYYRNSEPVFPPTPAYVAPELNFSPPQNPPLLVPPSPKLSPTMIPIVSNSPFTLHTQQITTHYSPSSISSSDLQRNHSLLQSTEVIQLSHPRTNTPSKDAFFSLNEKDINIDQTSPFTL